MADTTYDPTQVAALNKSREDAIAAGKDPYGGSLKDYASFTGGGANTDTRRYTDTGSDNSGGNSGSGSGSGTGTQSRYTDAAGKLYGPGGPLSTDVPDYSKVRKQQLQGVQGSIDAINELGAQQLAQAKQRTADSSGRARALGASAGIIGSPEYDRTEGDVARAGAQDEAATAAASQKQVSDILAGVDERARGIVDAAKTSASTNATSYLDYLKSVVTDAKSNMNDLAKAGATLSGKQRQQLIDQTGLDGDTFDSLYQSIKIANSNDYLNKDKPEIVGDKAVYFKRVQQKDGTYKIETETVQLPDSFGKQIAQTVARDDGIYVFYDDGTYEKVGQAKDDSQPGDNPQLYKGLSSATATAVRQKVSAFKTEQNVTNFSTVQDGYNFANSIDVKTTNPADDQALIYSLAKALDPGSVVREGEYATAQKYAQSWIAAYGKGVTQALAGTGFLSEQARKNIQAVIKQKYVTQKKSYDQTVNSYKTGINALTGRDNGGDFLTDYETQADSGGAEAEYGGKTYQQQPDGSWVEKKNNGGGKVSLNRPQRNNNPGNVKEGGIGDKYALKNADGSPKTDEQGHLIFPSASAGTLALRADIDAKVSGNSRYLGKDPTIAEIGGVYAEDPTWAKKVASIVGVSPSTKASQVNRSKLIDAIMHQEGYA